MSNHKFWDKIAPRYAKDKIRDIKSYERKLQTTQEHLTKSMNVLEIGCGTGMTAVIHSPFVQHYHATDISPTMIEIAKDRAKENQIENISFTVSDISNLSIKDASFDAILAMSVLHLLEDVPGSIHILHKKLKNGGLFISSTICLGDKMKYLKILIPFMKLVGFAPPTIHFLKKKELRTMMEANHFSVLHEWQPSQTKACFIIAQKL